MELKSGESPQLPPDLSRFWQQRIDRLLDGLPDSSGHALEVAAVLGEQVEQGEWLAVCRLLSTPPSRQLLDRLFAFRLARVESGAEGWSFVHGMLREAVLERAGDASPDRHRACALMLQQREGERGGLAARIGHHLLQAGDVQEGTERLLEGAWEHYRIGDLTLARMLLVERDQAMSGIVPGTDPAWGEGFLARARICVDRGELLEADEWLDRTIVGVRRHEWGALMSRLLLERAEIHHHRGEPVRLQECLSEALTLSRQNSDILAEACALRALGRAHMVHGDFGAAKTALLGAVRLFRRIPAPIEETHGILLLGEIARRRGNLEKAERLLRSTRTRAVRQGSQWGICSCDSSLGAVCRMRGDLPGAERFFRRSIERLRRLGLPTHSDTLRLAMVMIDQGQLRLARGELQRLLKTTPEELRPLRCLLHVVLLACLPQDDAWEEWAHHVSAARLQQAVLKSIDPDLGGALTRAGEAAALAGAPDRARVVFEMALAQWEMLNSQQDIAHVQAQILSLNAGST